MRFLQASLKKNLVVKKERRRQESVSTETIEVLVTGGEEIFGIKLEQESS